MLSQLNTKIAGAVLLTFLMSAVFATPNESMTRFSSSSSNNTSNSVSQENLAKLYGLDMTQWKKYQTVLKGPRGNWTPNLDPLIVLGIEAKTVKERNYWAEKLVYQERERSSKEIAFEISYQKSQERLFGHIPLYKNKPHLSSVRTTYEGNRHPNSRHLMFIKLPCEPCKNDVVGLVDSGLKIDIYFDKNATKKEIQAWANEASIPVDWVKSHRVTFNTYPKVKVITKQFQAGDDK